MLPKISFLARMSREPELAYSSAGNAYCRVGLVCGEKYQDKETSLFIDAVAFKKTAEMIATIPKGKRVYVTGKIQTESWEQDGQRRSKISMTIESFEFIEPRDSNHNAGAQQSTGNGFQQQPQHQQNNGFQSNTHPSSNPGGFQNNRG